MKWINWFKSKELKTSNPLEEFKSELDTLVLSKCKIVVLSGAGISKESGLNTFRDKNGLWTMEDMIENSSPQAFEDNPEKVLNFYNLRKEEMNSSKPNQAHTILGDLEKRLNLTIVTQNIDNLHELGGSKNVIHMHGDINRILCHKCKKRTSSKDLISFPNNCLNCQETNSLRPDVVFFKETPYHMDYILKIVNESHIFISVGTSGIIYPANYLGRIAANNKSITININPDVVGNGGLFKYNLKMGASEGLLALYNMLLKSESMNSKLKD